MQITSLARLGEQKYHLPSWDWSASSLISELGEENLTGVVGGETGGEDAVPLPVVPGGGPGGGGGGGQVDTDQQDRPEGEEEDHA